MQRYGVNHFLLNKFHILVYDTYDNDHIPQPKTSVENLCKCFQVPVVIVKMTTIMVSDVKGVKIQLSLALFAEHYSQDDIHRTTIISQL